MAWKNRVRREERRRPAVRVVNSNCSVQSMAGSVSSGAQEGEGAVVGAEELVRGEAGDGGVFVDGLAGETLGVAQLGGDDVLEEVGYGPGVVDVAGERERGGVGGEEGVPALGGGVVPGDELFGGEGGDGVHGLFTVMHVGRSSFFATRVGVADGDRPRMGLNTGVSSLRCERWCCSQLRSR